MRITRDNYEVYFIDFIDGNLDASLQEEMRLFLAANPDLSEEMDGLDGFSFNAESHSGINKSDLYKSVAPGEKPVHPPVVSKHEKPVGAKPVVLPRLKAPEIIFDAKFMLYQQQSVASVIPISPKSETGARVVTMRRTMYYASAAAAIAVLLWFNMPSTSHKAGMASEWEKEVINGVSKDSIRENASPSKPRNMERVNDVSNDVYRVSGVGLKNSNSDVLFLTADLLNEEYETVSWFKKCSKLKIRVNESYCTTGYYEFNMTKSTSALEFMSKP